MEAKEWPDLLELQDALVVVRRYVDEYGTLDPKSINHPYELALHKTVINGINHCCREVETAEYNHNVEKVMEYYGVDRNEAKMIIKYGEQYFYGT